MLISFLHNVEVLRNRLINYLCDLLFLIERKLHSYAMCLLIWHISYVGCCLYVLLRLNSWLWCTNRLLRFQLTWQNSVGIVAVPSALKKWQSEDKNKQKSLLYSAWLESSKEAFLEKKQMQLNANFSFFIAVGFLRKGMYTVNVNEQWMKCEPEKDNRPHIEHIHMLYGLTLDMQFLNIPVMS